MASQLFKCNQCGKRAEPQESKHFTGQVLVDFKCQCGHKFRRLFEKTSTGEWTDVRMA